MSFVAVTANRRIEILLRKVLLSQTNSHSFHAKQIHTAEWMTGGCFIRFFFIFPNYIWSYGRYIWQLCQWLIHIFFFHRFQNQINISSQIFTNFYGSTFGLISRYGQCALGTWCRRLFGAEHRYWSLNERKQRTQTFHKVPTDERWKQWKLWTKSMKLYLPFSRDFSLIIISTNSMHINRCKIP